MMSTANFILTEKPLSAKAWIATMVFCIVFIFKTSAPGFALLGRRRKKKHARKILTLAVDEYVTSSLMYLCWWDYLLITDTMLIFAARVASQERKQRAWQALLRYPPAVKIISVIFSGWSS